MQSRGTLIKWSLAAAVLVGIVLGLYYYWHHQALYPSTADAYVQAHVVRIAPQVTGRVLRVHVQENQRVEAGQLLLEIDPQPFRIALDKSRANLDATRQELAADDAAVQAARDTVAERQAQLAEAQQNLDRALPLVRKKLLPPSEGDTARDARDAAQAQLEVAKSELTLARRKRGEPGAGNSALRAATAEVAQSKLDLEHTSLVAPGSGTITNLSVRPGSVVVQDTPLFALVENGRWWVDANYKETDLHHIRPGMPASVDVDMYPGVHFNGVVQSISPASGVAFSLFPPENATGNWVKVTQRFPVRVTIRQPDLTHPLRIGASAKVTVDTTAARAVTSDERGH